MDVEEKREPKLKIDVEANIRPNFESKPPYRRR